jgi:hypothetical protein
MHVCSLTKMWFRPVDCLPRVAMPLRQSSALTDASGAACALARSGMLELGVRGGTSQEQGVLYEGDVVLDEPENFCHWGRNVRDADEGRLQ